jgi:hypothetical protein
LTINEARVIAQRLRNNVMRELGHLAEGDVAAHSSGFGNYFEDFFMEVPYGGVEPNPSMTSDEIEALARFLARFREACDATPKNMLDASFIASGWPTRLAPLAAETLAVFSRRGFLHDEAIDAR